MRRREPDRTLVAWASLALAVGACFGGDFVQGLACEGDADCGPRLSCIEGLCGGPGDPALCGNGLRDVGEQCDDGNVNDGDGCSADCLFPPVCGDGIPQEGEACDDGNLVENDACTTRCTSSPEAPDLELNVEPIKQFKFSWEPGLGADYYRLFERVNPGEEFVPVGGEIDESPTSLTVPLHFRASASYKLSACNALRCAESQEVDVVGGLAEAVGYIKASNTGGGDFFGTSVALSGDGNTLAVGAADEDSSATGIDGEQGDDSLAGAGAVYVFVRGDEGWSQQAYVKASNPGAFDAFGCSVALSRDGRTLAVGARSEKSNATGVDNGQINDTAVGAGAVYVFTRDGEVWSQQAYVKASNTEGYEEFGGSVALSGDGATLAVGADAENSGASGVGSDQEDDTAVNAGAVYVFTRSDKAWAQQAYVKASNTGANDRFGASVALAGDGDSLIVGAPGEASNATGINADQIDDSIPGSGAVYVFTRSGGAWAQQTYVKASSAGKGSFGTTVTLSGDGRTLAAGATGDATVYIFVRADETWSQQADVKASNSNKNDVFGRGLALSEDGNVLGVGAALESGSATGVNGEQTDELGFAVGALYVFTRSDENWSQSAYVKPPVSAASYYFGGSVALSSEGDTLISSADSEGSAARGIGGEQFDDGASNSGAVYVY